MSRHDNRWGLVLCALCVSLCLLAAQGQSQNTPSAPPAEASQSAASPYEHVGAKPSPAKDSTSPQASEKLVPDTAAQIDELIKESNEAINIKVQFQRAEELARQALELSEKAGDKVRVANAMIYLSAALGYQGRLAESLEVAERNVVVARETGDQKILEQALNSAGSIIGGLGRYEEALGFFTNAWILPARSTIPPCSTCHC